MAEEAEPGRVGAGVVAVDFGVLDASAAEWRTAAEDLDGAVLRLGLVTGAGLAPAVGAEVDRFTLRWLAEARALAGRARSGGEAIGLVGRDLRAGDELQAARLRSLLPGDLGGTIGGH